MNEALGKSKNSLRSALVLAAVLGSGGGLAVAQSNTPPCPDSVLAPFGLAPNNGQFCSTPNCLLPFKGVKWWVAYHFGPEGYYNGGLNNIFSPNNVSLGNDGLHLKIAQQNNCRDSKGKVVWCSAEAVAMFQADGQQANLGYGDYLVDAQLVSPPLATWADYDPNVALGLFTYERPGSGTADNPAREIDLAEVSRWGWDHTGECPFNYKDGNFNGRVLCNGNSQFALQKVTVAGDESVKRYNIGAVREITLVMRWREGLVNFEEYNRGGLTLPMLDADQVTIDNQWTTPDNLSKFIPTDRAQGQPSCQRFHINLWLGNYGGTVNGLNPGPTNPVEVVIKDFEFRPPQP
jgi:hypothetical protein